MDKQKMIEILSDVLKKINELINLLAEDEGIQIEEPVTEEVPKIEGTKKAYCVGINKYAPRLHANLRGCVHDAKNMSELLIEQYGFPQENVRRTYNRRATKQRILENLDWLVSDAKPGDELVFFYSGHGSQVDDLNGDEADGLDEILCPTDLDWNDPLTDDILATYFKRVPVGAHLTFICDSCNSGTVSRNVLKPIEKEANTRFLEPPKTHWNNKESKKINRIGIKATGIEGQRHALFAACAEDGYSEEARFGKIISGVFTTFFVQLCKKNNGIYTLKEMESEIIKLVKVNKFDQDPQLYTDPSRFNDPLFNKK